MALTSQQFESLKKRLRAKKPESKKGFLNKFADVSGKVLGFGTKVTGIKKGVEAIAPAAEALSIGGTYLQGELGRNVRERALLGEAISPQVRTAEKEGLGAGIKQTVGTAIEAGAQAAPFVTGGLGTSLRGKGKGILGFANSFVGRSAEIAFAQSLGKGLQKNQNTTEILRNASIKGAVSAGTSFLLGATMNKIVNSFQGKAQD